MAPSRRPASLLSQRLSQRCALASCVTVGAEVEPAQVFLAAERTLIAWLRTALLVGSFAIALYNSTHLNSPINYMAMIYAVISIIAVFYAGYMYNRRCRQITEKHAGHFGALEMLYLHKQGFDDRTDELYGPAVLSVLLFAAVLANFIIRGACCLLPCDKQC